MHSAVKNYSGTGNIKIIAVCADFTGTAERKKFNHTTKLSFKNKNGDRVIAI
jgi:hypothetical protein